MTTKTYKSYIIFVNEYNGFYWTYTREGKKSADTFEGIKNLIDNLK